jgi:poly(3-hydroxybutyrate) depolymerase
MNQRLGALMLSLMIVTMTLSGCISSEETEGKEIVHSPPEEPEYFEKGEYNCIDYDDMDRCWQTHVPENLSSDLPVPLIVDIHGWGGTAGGQMFVSDFNTIADEYGAVVIYPAAVEPVRGWNAGWCCESHDDLGFILRLVDIAIQIHDIDTDRIYATGWSNGCAMSQMLAMKASDIFAAIGCMAQYLNTDYDSTYSPIPVIEVHGMLDQIIVYASSASNSIQNPNSPSQAFETGAIQNMYDWGEYNGCSGSPETFEVNGLYSIHGFNDCQNGAEVRLMSIYAAQHNPYAKDAESDGTIIADVLIGTQGLVQSSYIVWDFISQYSKTVDEVEI